MVKERRRARWPDDRYEIATMNKKTIEIVQLEGAPRRAASAESGHSRTRIIGWPSPRGRSTVCFTHQLMTHKIKVQMSVMKYRLIQRFRLVTSLNLFFIWLPQVFGWWITGRFRFGIVSTALGKNDRKEKVFFFSSFRANLAGLNIRLSFFFLAFRCATQRSTLYADN